MKKYSIALYIALITAFVMIPGSWAWAVEPVDSPSGPRTAAEAYLDDLTITPGQVSVSPGKTISFSVTNAASDSDTGDAVLLWTASMGDVSSEGLYTAPDTIGSHTVSVTDLLNGRTADASVHVRQELVITPDTAAVTAGGSRAFTVSGGEPPYTWNVSEGGSMDDPSGDTVTFTAGTRTGTSRILVIDKNGIKAEAEVEITGAIIVSPASITLMPLGETTFSAPGVSGVTWEADKGIIDQKGNYTAPAQLGRDTVTARDSLGNESAATVIVADIPVITPAMAWIEKGDSVSFDLLGGTPPYTWYTDAGNIEGSTDSAVYTSPDLSGEFTIKVRDSLAQEASAVIYVDLELRATREEIFVKPGEMAKIAVTGGVPPFDWQTVTGDLEEAVTENAGFNIYTAPGIMGQDTVTIRDRKNNTVSVTVHVTTPLQVTPNVRYLTRGDSARFTVVSGVPPYVAAIIDGDGEIFPESGGSDFTGMEGVFTFTAGKTADDDVVIEFTDNTGQTVTAHAFVEATLRVSRATIYVDINSEVSFRVTGGTGGYVAIAGAGDAHVDSETGRGTYKSIGRYDNDTITIFDSMEQSLDILVVVAKPTPVISPSIAHMEAGQSRAFMVTMGSPPYDWAIEAGRFISIDENNSVVEITAPEVSGTYTLTVSDAGGNQATANFSVTLPLAISPSSMTVYQGTSPSLRVLGVGGIPPYQWISSEVTVEEHDTFAVIKPETRVNAGKVYSLECRDSAGKTVSMNVIVSRIPGDLNGDGILDDDEMINVIEAYTDDTPVQGIKIDPVTMYSHAESFIDN
ncbi:MAG: hypothetical protein HQK66_00950 [Desulfamplus sp.]|nr:hypothetical protein [Desulfamplus sp.]